MTDGLLIRPAAAADAATIARLANELSLHEGFGADVFSEAQVLEDGFGENPAYFVVLAERAGETLGYALYQPFYNTDLAIRGLWLSDLFVLEAARGRGIGRRLVAAVARRAVETGAGCVWWGVRSANQEARAFYATLGARDEDARILELDGATLQALAGEAA